MSRIFQMIVAVATAGVLGAGCSDNGEDKAGDSGAKEGDPPTLDEIDTNKVCDDVTTKIGEVTSRVMLLEDKSLSMDDRLGGSTKWSIAVDAITTMVTSFEDSIQFGLDLFPYGPGGNCSIGSEVLEDVAFNNASSIVQTLNANGPDGATPLLLAMGNFLDASYAPGFTNGEPGGYLVVVSDGQDTCNDNGIFIDANTGASAAQLSAVTSDLLNAGIQTFVIGFGSGIDPDQLNAIAEAGGTEFNNYFDAQNEEDLNEALDSIGQEVIVSCEYQLGSVSEDANIDFTNIYFDGTGIARGDDCSGGADWMWGNAEKTIIHFCEDACAQLENDEVDELRVIIMCDAGDVIVV